MAELAEAPAARRPPRLPALTGVRILAALAVYFSHLGPPAGSPKPLTAFMASGYMGVTLFFVLSGFVLALNYADRLRRPSIRSVWGFAVARFARVYPLYVLVLLYVMVRQRSFGGSLDGWWQHVLAIQAWSPNLGVAYGFNSPGWSVSVEFFLYACFPLLIPVLARLRTPRRTLLVALGVTVVLVGVTAWFAATGRNELGIVDPGSAHRWLYRTPLLRLGDFALGILAAVLYLQTREHPGARRWGGRAAAAAGVVTVGLMAWPAHVTSVWSWDVSYALPAVVLTYGLAVAPAARLARVLSLPFVVLLGEASYAFYLVHHPALALFGGGRWAGGFSVTNAAFELLTLGAILCLAVGLHHMVERPARTWLRRLLHDPRAPSWRGRRPSPRDPHAEPPTPS